MLHSLVLLLAWSPGGPLLRHSRSVSDVVGARLMEDDADHAQLLLQVAAQAAKASLEKGSSPEDAKAAGAAAWEAARRAGAGEGTEAVESPPNPKAKTDRFFLQFTCTATLDSGETCGTLNVHSISRHAYRKGTVFVRCPSCNSSHLVADNLNWIGDVGTKDQSAFTNLEEYMEKQGTPVTRLAGSEERMDEVASGLGAEEPDETPAPSSRSEPLPGIDPGQAQRCVSSHAPILPRSHLSNTVKRSRPIFPIYHRHLFLGRSRIRDAVRARKADNKRRGWDEADWIKGGGGRCRGGGGGADS